MDYLTLKTLHVSSVAASYVVLGTIALKRGKTKRARVAAWVAAQVVFLYIVLVAVTKNAAWPL